MNPPSLTLILSLSLLLPACASHQSKFIEFPPPRRDVAGTALPADGIESVRYAENIKAYPINRYIDPANRLVMHEGHVLYRVETTANWNLHPNRPVRVAAGPRVAMRGTALNASPLPGELSAELARQKEATGTVITQGERLQQSVSRLQAALDSSQAMAKSQIELKKQLDAANQRIRALEESKGDTPPPLPEAAASPDAPAWDRPAGDKTNP
jgi:hypothetical protein